MLEVENEDTVELQKEINILRECDSDYIVRYKGSYEKDGNVWIVMESATSRTPPVYRYPAARKHNACLSLTASCTLFCASAVRRYCGAGSLCDLMAVCERTLTEEQIAVIMRASLHGLHYLHSAKKIHRDIKSGNILLNHDGDAKLADFGTHYHPAHRYPHRPCTRRLTAYRCTVMLSTQASAQSSRQP